MMTDLSGKRFGRLIALAPSGRGSSGNVVWRVRCDCGTVVEVRSDSLRSGHTSSCGCLHRDRVISSGRNNRRHGESHPPSHEFISWTAMISRCCNPNRKDYHRYGGRGIAVCQEWRASYEAFLGYVGRRPSDAHSLDRINNKRGYDPGNVRWATHVEQNRNTRQNRVVTMGEMSLTLAEWAERTGIKANTLWWRLEQGWSVERALCAPTRRWRHGGAP